MVPLGPTFRIHSASGTSSATCIGCTSVLGFSRELFSTRSSACFAACGRVTPRYSRDAGSRSLRMGAVWGSAGIPHYAPLHSSRCLCALCAACLRSPGCDKLHPTYWYAGPNTHTRGDPRSVKDDWLQPMTLQKSGPFPSQLECPAAQHPSRSKFHFCRFRRYYLQMTCFTIAL